VTVNTAPSYTRLLIFSYSHELHKLGAAYLYVSPRQDELTSWDISMRIMQFMTSLTLRSIFRPELINVPAILAFSFDPTSGVSNETVAYGITQLMRLMLQLYLHRRSRPFSDVDPASEVVSRWRTDQSTHAFLFVQAARLQRELGNWKEEEHLLLECESLYRQAEDGRGRMIPLCRLCDLYVKTNKRWKAEEKFDEAVAIHHQLKGGEDEGVDLYILGETYRYMELTGKIVGRATEPQLQLENAIVKVNSEPWGYSAYDGDLGLFKLLMSARGIRLNAKDLTGRTPLAYAAQMGNSEMVKLLLEIDHTEPDLRDNEGRTPLSYATEMGNSEVVALLLKTGIVVPDSRDDNGRTPLSYAAQSGNSTKVKLLLDTGKVVPDSQDNKGRTALSYTTEMGKSEIVKLLLEAGKMEPDVSNPDRQTLPFCAMGIYHSEMVGDVTAMRPSSAPASPAKQTTLSAASGSTLKDDDFPILKKYEDRNKSLKHYDGRSLIENPQERGAEALFTYSDGKGISSLQHGSTATSTAYEKLKQYEEQFVILAFITYLPSLTLCQHDCHR
jgi:hypothetical protein